MRELQQRITLVEFRELLALERISPNHETLMQLYLAQLALFIAESNRDNKLHAEPFQLKDFIIKPRRKRKDAPIAEEVIEAFFRALVGQQNGNDSKP